MFCKKQVEKNDNSDIIENDDCIDAFIKSEKIKPKNRFYGKTKVFNRTINSNNVSLVDVYTFYSKDTEYYISIIWSEGFDGKIKKEYLVFLCFVIFVFIFRIVILSRIILKVTAPLSFFSKKIEFLSNCKFLLNDINKIKSDLPINENDEIGKLAQAFSLMIDNLTANIRQLVETRTRAERMQSELNVAREIQLGSLPRNFSFAAEKGIELYAHLIPAREIGGDLYDFFFIDDDHVCIAVGDVADKGVPAALFMVIVKKLISSKANERGRTLYPAEIMSEMNEMLCKDNQSATFVTLFIGILNVKNGELRYANGGHVPPVFTDGSNTPFFKKELSGPVVGVLPGVKYKEMTTALQQNGAVFVCTDGITEAMNEEEELFGEKRLLENFSRMQDKTCNEVIDGILREVRAYAGQAPQSDDIAMLMIRWGGENKNADVAREQNS